jgi:uncharacterized membrane protein
MRVGAFIEIAAPCEAVWEQITDPTRYLDFMSGVTRWEVVGDERMQLGSRYRMLFRAGAAEVGGLIEVIEFSPPGDMAWTSVLGLDQRGRWRLRERREGGRTQVELRLAYGVAGAGLFGWLAERIAAPSVRTNLQRTLQQLKRQVEHEQTRAQAAARRGTRARAGAS